MVLICVVEEGELWIESQICQIFYIRDGDRSDVIYVGHPWERKLKISMLTRSHDYRFDISPGKSKDYLVITRRTLVAQSMEIYQVTMAIGIGKAPKSRPTGTD